MQAYARGDRRRGRAPLHPDVPGRARGPGADRVPHPPPRQRPEWRTPGGARAGARARLRDRRGSESTKSHRSPVAGRLQLGYVDERGGRARRLTLKDQAIADAALPGHSEAYRQLDTGVLETLLLKGALGLSDEDISHFNGLFYARDTAEALALVRSGRVRRRLPDAPHPGGARSPRLPRRARTCRRSRRTSSPSCSPGCCSTHLRDRLLRSTM